MNNGVRDAAIIGMISQAKANALSGISASSPLAYNSKTGVVSANGLTQDVTVVTQVTPAVLTSVLHFTNGVLTSIT